MNITYCPFCLATATGETCPRCGKSVFYTGRRMHLQVGYVLTGTHPYVLGASLGQGGFGITYIALDTVTGRRVAIKEYFPTYCAGRDGDVSVMPYSDQDETYAKGKTRFLEEARMLRSLSDLDSVVDVVDFFDANNTAYLVMEFLDGSSLKDLVEGQGRLPAQTFLAQLQPLMADMQRMHQRGVIHRDIAPDNIIMLSDGRLKLIDFGAARSYLGDKSMTVVVKKGFAPVEQYMRKGTGACTDIYALAASVYYCITGVVPPDSAERQYGETSLLAPSALGADITPVQELALEKALEIQPSARTQTMTEFMEQLSGKPEIPVGMVTPSEDRTGTGNKAPEIPVTPERTKEETRQVSGATVEKKKRSSRKPRKGIIAAVAVAGLLAVAGIAVGISSLGKEKPKPQPSVQVTEAPVRITETKPAPAPRQKNYMRFVWDETKAFGLPIEKKQVRRVVFLDTVESAPREVYDLSEKQDRSVMAWMDANNVLYIAAKGPIVAPKESWQMFRGFSVLEEISFNDCFDTSNVTDMRSMFYGCTALKKLDLSSFDTRNVAYMSRMFNECSSLETLDVSSFDTRNVTNMSLMFNECSGLETLDLSSFDTRNVTDMSQMFHSCSGLKTLDLSSFDTRNVKYMSWMFNECSGLESLDLSSFDFSNVKDASFMFCGCEKLVSVNIGSINLPASAKTVLMFAKCPAFRNRTN